MSTGQMQRRNAQNVRLLSADLQPRYEPNFAWKSACSAYLALPGLRAFWPTSSVDYAAASRARDISGSGYHLTDNNTPDFGFDSLAPYVVFNGTTQYLSRADGGVGNWADLQGVDTFILGTQQGITIGCWFYPERITTNESVMGKTDTTAAGLAYELRFRGDVANDPMYFQISTGAAAVIASVNFSAAVDTWYFIAGRFDPSTEVKVYVNALSGNNLVGVPANAIDSSAAFTIGATAVPSLYFDGRVSMAFLCAACLSDAIILSLFHQTRAMFGV